MAASVTELLLAWSNGDREALDRLIPLVYSELRRRAGAQLARERSSHTLQPTALVHEAFLKLVDQRNARWNSRAQFFAVAAQLMRRILVDHARGLAAARRGGPQSRLPIELAADVTVDEGEGLLDLHLALERLAELSERQARIVELRFFGGLSVAESAEVLDLSVPTVVRDWRFARAWLRRELGMVRGEG